MKEFGFKEGILHYVVPLYPPVCLINCVLKIVKGKRQTPQISIVSPWYPNSYGSF